MLTEGIKVVNRKTVEWVDDGGYTEPFLRLQIGDIELLETIIKAVKDGGWDFARDLELEYEELKKIRLQKRKEYGDLKIPDGTVDMMIEKLQEDFMSPNVDRECDEDDVYDLYAEYEEEDDDLPKWIDWDTTKKIIKAVNEYVAEQKEMAENDAWIREASYRW